MRICIDLTSLSDNFSGIERFAFNITKNMLDSNDEYILLFKKEVYPYFKEINRENITKIVFPEYKKFIFYQLVLPFKLYKIKADVYFFPAFPAPFLFFNKKQISAIHDMSCWDYPDKNKRYMSLYFKLLYWKSSLGNKKIVTVSEFSKDRIINILNKKPTDIYVIYNGLSEQFLHFKYDALVEKRIKEKYILPENYILCLSTIEPRKNMRLLIEAYELLVNNYDSNFDLLIAGRKGWLVDNLLTDIDEKILKRIHFTGFVDDDDLPYIYLNAKIFVFPSLYEGFGIPPIEAMAMELPVLSSDAGAMPEVLGDAAIFFKSENVDSLVSQINSFMKIDDDRLSRVKKISKRQASKYSWLIESRKFLDIVHDLHERKCL